MMAGLMSICRLLLVVGLYVGAVANVVAVDSADFARDVQPILANNCFACHGPDEAQRKGGLQLHAFDYATARLPSGNSAIMPGRSNQSELIRRVTANEDGVRMPPPETGKRLTPEQIETLRRWIDSGAEYAEHWAFRPITRPELPQLDDADADWVRTPVDVFVMAELRKRGLSPSPEADRRTLIRRLYYDLTGLPPSAEEIEAFEKDTDPQAYEKLVERLLASPHYGERWARHWLDVVHYGDTHGFDKDKLRRNAWPYRDYVIRSFNDDKPYERFVLEQLAGDVLYPDDPDGIVATGFIAAGPWDYVGHVELREGTIDKAITRNLDRDDMVATAMNTFVSLTAQCARCHDHKFDPITLKDYYQLQAIFAAVDRADRPYPSENTRRRQTLVNERKTVQKQIDSLDGLVAQRGGEVVAALNVEVQELRNAAQKDTKGYHSDIARNEHQVKWVQVDLGETVPLTRIELWPAYDPFNNIGEDFGFPPRYRVEVSDDPMFTNAVIVADHTANDVSRPRMHSQVVHLDDVRARFVRVTATKLAPRRNDYIFALAELRVIDSTGRNIARDATVTSLDSIEAPTAWSKANLVDGKMDERSVSAAISALDARRRTLRDQFLNDRERETYAALTRRMESIGRELDSIPADSLVYAAATDFKQLGQFRPTRGRPRPIHILYRGNEKSPGEQVGPGVPRIGDLSAEFDLPENHTEGERRVALARWIIDRRNPLTWRSIVNRVWQYHFGQGIVETPNDFGRMGAVPTHPELLDYLAATFRDGGQSIKDLHRMIVCSATYRQSSAHDPEKARIDAGNQFLWRQNRQRLDAEAIRDSVLVMAGKLDTTMYGPGYFTFAFKDDHSPGYFYDRYNPDDPTSHRRSIYRLIVRSVPDPFMEVLDCADPSQAVAKRLETLTPLQALSLLNNGFMVRMSEHFADRVAAMADDVPDQLRAAMRLALGRDPTSQELSLLTSVAQEHGLSNACRLILNLNEFVFVD